MLIGQLSLSGEDGVFVQKLKALDLGPIAYKLMHPDEGRGWTRAEASRAIARYMMFLSLVYFYPNTPLVPTQEIDRVWHHHILDTSKYAEDCQMLFGQFIHHFPYFGQRDEADRQNLDKTFAQTQALFQKHFGTDITDDAEIQSENLAANRSRKPRACVLQRRTTKEYRPRVHIELA